VVFGAHRSEAVIRAARAHFDARPGRVSPRDRATGPVRQYCHLEGIGASQHGIGMACARIAEIVLRNEPAVIPIASYNAEYGATLSSPSVLGRSGLVRLLEPPMSDKEREALRRSADTLKSASARMRFSPS
jgi:malate/lactate dehydrogenase-like protein